MTAYDVINTQNKQDIFFAFTSISAQKNQKEKIRMGAILDWIPVDTTPMPNIPQQPHKPWDQPDIVPSFNPPPSNPFPVWCNGPH